MTLRNLSFYLLSITFLLACTSDGGQDTDSIDFSTGSFIINEGNFQSGTGSIDFLALDGNYYPNIYSSNNDNLPIGNVAQSMIIHNGIAFIAVNNDHKIIACNTNGFKHEYTLDDIRNPRYFVEADNDHIIFSTWGMNGSNGSIQKINSRTGNITLTKNIGGSPERLLTHGNKLYVTMSKGFERDHRLLIFDMVTFDFLKELNVGDDPNAIAIDEAENIWVVSGGHTDWDNPENNTPAQLSKIVRDEIVDTLHIDAGANDIAINNTTGELLYLSWNGLFSVDIRNLESNEMKYPGYYYGLKRNHLYDEIWLANAKDFTSNGTIIRLDNSYTIVDSLATGIIPSDFYFN